MDRSKIIGNSLGALVSLALFGGITKLADAMIGKNYNFGENKVRVEYAGAPFWCYAGDTTFEFADGTTTNFPYEMNKKDIVSFLVKNSEHSRMNLENQ